MQLFAGLEAPLFKTSTILYELLGAISLMICLKQCPGTMGYLMASAVPLYLTGKHYLEHEIVHSPLLIFSWVLCFASAFYSHFLDRKNKTYINIFMLAGLVNSLICLYSGYFVTIPTMPSKGTSAAEYNQADATLGFLGMYFLASTLCCCPGAMGSVMSSGLLLAYMGYKAASGAVVPISAFAFCGAVFGVNTIAVSTGSGHEASSAASSPQGNKKND